MFLFDKSDRKTTYGVLIDISSGSVGVSIVESNRDSVYPTLLFTHRNTMRITKHGGEKSENQRHIREALFSASLVLSQEGLRTLLERDKHARITKLYITCSAPWAYTVARYVYYENDVPFKISTSIINDLVQSAETEIISDLEGNSLLTNEGFTIVEQATTDITINDYPVENPLHLKGKTLGLSHVAGLIPQEILNSVEEVQKKLFPGTELRAHTYMLVMYCVLRDLFPQSQSMVIIDITAEATEFAVVEHNVLVKNISSPIGSSTLIRDIMEKSGKPAVDIESFMKDGLVKNQIGAGEFAPFRELYTNSLMSAFQTILEHRTLPKDVVITVDNAYKPFFEALILNAFKDVTGKKPHQLTMKETFIHEVAGETEPDIYLANAARFFHKLHGCGALEEA